MTPTRTLDRIDRWFWAAVVVSLAVSLTPWGEMLLSPFKLFTTWVHECGHAAATLLVGGRVTSITIAPDTSGLTQSLVPDSRFARGVVASSGYLGAAVVGCLLLAATRVEKWAHVILLALGVFMLATVVFWMRNLFGVAIVLGWGVALIALSKTRVPHVVRFLLSLLAIQVALNAVFDIRVLFQIDHGRSDAVTMSTLFLLPSWMWATLWMATSVALLGATIWATRRY